MDGRSSQQNQGRERHDAQPRRACEDELLLPLLRLDRGLRRRAGRRGSQPRRLTRTRRSLTLGLERQLRRLHLPIRGALAFFRSARRYGSGRRRSLHNGVRGIRDDGDRVAHPCRVCAGAGIGHGDVRLLSEQHHGCKAQHRERTSTDERDLERALASLGRFTRSFGGGCGLNACRLDCGGCALRRGLRLRTRRRERVSRSALCLLRAARCDVRKRRSRLHR